MAHTKTGVSITPPKEVNLKVSTPRVGDEKDGLVWDGQEWIPKIEPERGEGRAEDNVLDEERG